MVFGSVGVFYEMVLQKVFLLMVFKYFGGWGVGLDSYFFVWCFFYDDIVFLYGYLKNFNYLRYS